MVAAGVHARCHDIQAAPVTTSPDLFQVCIQSLPGFFRLKVTINNVMRDRPRFFISPSR
jgi:hypothetical protein